MNGTELANERVGGSEGLRRLRELRDDGYIIQQRRHPEPGRDIWQYRLVDPNTTTPVRSAEPTRIVFGLNRICTWCDGKKIRQGNACEVCGGKGWI